MRWILLGTLILLAFPVLAQTPPPKPTFTDLAFYTNEPQAAAGLLSAGASILSAVVALIAVGVSIRIASNARKTAEAANATAKSALKATEENTKTLYRIERPYITGGGGWDYPKWPPPFQKPTFGRENGFAGHPLVERSPQRAQTSSRSPMDRPKARRRTPTCPWRSL